MNDWLYQSYKATCGDDERIAGLSQDHRVLCFAQADQDFVNATNAEWKVLSGPESAFGQHGGGDWAVGLKKYECPVNSIAKGYAHDKGRPTGLLCALSTKNLGHDCQTLQFSQGDMRLSVRGGDWARNSYKGQCADHQYMAGMAMAEDKVQAIYCCSIR